MIKLGGHILLSGRNNFSGTIRRTMVFRRTAYVSAGLLLLLLLLTLCPVYLVPSVTEAATKDPNPSTPGNLALTIAKPNASVSFNLTYDPTKENGSFATSSNNEKASFSVATNNATGYTLNLKTSSNTTSLSDGTNTIASITNTNGITADNFTANTWGLLPSKYNGTANTGDNPNYYPASTTGFKMDETSAANTTANTYTVGLGIKADYNTPAGTYTNTAVVAEYVANAVTYAIHYYDNAGSGATISGMPSVNPQTGTVAQGTTSTSVNLASAPTRTGYTFSGWCLGDSASVSNITTTNGVDSCSSTVYTAGQSFGIDATVSPDTYYLFAMWTGNEYTATIYYNNKTSSGTSGATPSITSNNTAKCRVTSVAGTSCTIIDANIPSAVKSSVGQYNNAYVGLATTTSTMSSTTDISLSGNATFYAVYRTSATLYYPSSTSARNSKTLYRNQWLTSASAMGTTVLSDSTTGTSNYSPSTPVSSYSIAGYSASASTNTSSYAGVSNMAATNTTTFYMILSASKSATFYYNNNTTPTSGTSSVTNTTKTATQYVRCTSSAAEISNSNYASITTYGTYNNALIGWATSTGIMTTAVGTTVSTATTGNLYAVYRTNVTNYYYTGSAYNNRTLYRNQTLSSVSAMGTTYLSDTSTGLSDYSTAGGGPNSSTWYGLSTALSNTTRTYSSVAAAATSTSTTLNSIYRFTQNFSSTGSTGVSGIGSTVQYCYVSSTGNTAGGTSCSVTTPTISVNTGYTSLGWGTQGHTAQGTAASTSYTVSTSGGTLYANAKLNTFNLVITGDANVSAVSVKKGSTSGTSTTCTKSGTTFTCSSLDYGVKYYLYPTFNSGYEFNSWAKTDSATNASLGSTSTENTYYQMGNGAGAVTLTSKSSCNSTAFSGYMQDMTASTVSGRCVGTSGTLTDRRDNKTYKVAKLADNKLWMLDNLAIDLTAVSLAALQGNTNASNQTLTYLKNGGGSSPYTNYAVAAADSNNYYDRPAIATSGTCNNAYCVNNPESGKWKWDAVTSATINGVTSKAQGQIGVYYNYCAASAGSFCYSSSGPSSDPNTSSLRDITSDICPYGWHLPTSTSSGEFQALYTAYSSNSTNFQTALSTPLSGYFGSGKADTQGIYGHFWSSTWNNSTSMYSLYVNSTSVYPNSSYFLNYGNSVRCVFGS